MTDASRNIRAAIAEPVVDDSTVDRVLDGAVRRRRAMVRRRRALAVSSTLIAAGIVVVALRPRHGGDLRRVDGSPLVALAAPSSGAAQFAFDDGSRVELSAASALRVAFNDGQRVGWTLERGAVRFSVRPRGPRQWTIDAGLAVVSVIGTEFVVDRSANHVRVAVFEGVVRVEVSGIDSRIHRLTAGQSVVIEPPSPLGSDASASSAPSTTEPVGDDVLAASAALEAGAMSPDDASNELTNASDAGRPARPNAVAAQRPAWRSLAEQGEYRRAYELLGSNGVARAAAGSSSDSLLALADVARLSGHPAEAVAPLEQLLREHPSDSAAPLAAYTLGRVFASLSRHEEAARSFDRALSLGAPRAIEEDVRWLLVRARSASGDRAAAQRAADEYRARFSDGRHARAIDALLGPPR